jgi:hypothetical protein
MGGEEEGKKPVIRLGNLNGAEPLPGLSTRDTLEMKKKKKKKRLLPTTVLLRCHTFQLPTFT